MTTSCTVPFLMSDEEAVSIRWANLYYTLKDQPGLRNYYFAARIANACLSIKGYI